MNFAAFAILLSLRDIVYDLFFSKTIRPALFSFIVVAVILAGSCLTLLFTRAQVRAVRWSGRLAMCLLLLGVMAACIYWVTFAAISKLGAGTFNLIDYGATPLLTALLGVAMFREGLRRHFWLALLLYAAGLWLLIGHILANSVMWILLALTSPVFTAISDALSKKLLVREQSPPTGALLLAGRFAFAMPLLLAVVMADDTIQAPTWADAPSLAGAAACAALLGFLPLLLLMRGLKTGQLQSLAAWEMCIPAFAFLGTAFFRIPREHLFSATIGALLILLGATVLNRSTSREERPHAPAAT